MTTKLLLNALGAAVLAAGIASGQTPKLFDPPAQTTWRPDGCRAVPATNPLLPSRSGWRSLHADTVNTDEVFVALTPVFHADWVAEPQTFNPTGPVFDDAGNLYFSPFLPYESIVLVSLDPATGARRWSIPNTTGAPAGAGTPLVLNDPASLGDQVLYLGLYDRALAVRPDGTVVWDVPTGLVQTANAFDNLVFGVNYHPQADAIVGLTKNGFIYALDRASGMPLLAVPYQLPGEPSPPGAPIALPPPVLAIANGLLASFVNLPPGTTIQDFRNVLLGNEAEVANYFAIDPHTGRLWVAATAPDEADGTTDGVSELGALYGLDLVPDGGGWAVVEGCHRFFLGGSASTPTLRADGARVYVADNFGKLLAIETDCTDAWELDTGEQIFGSIGVSSDNHEVYASSRAGILQVIDEGAAGTVRWQAEQEVYENLSPGQQNVNLNLVGIGANGFFVQLGAAFVQGTTILPLRTGIAQLDRETGHVRYFADGLEETVAVMSIGPDGALYVGNSPVRRIFAVALGQVGTLPPGAPLLGGIRKWAPARLELLARDALCAARDRAASAFATRGPCPDSAAADVTQIGALIAQGLRAGEQAVADGDLTAAAWKGIRKNADKAAHMLKVPTLKAAATQLGKACAAFD